MHVHIREQDPLNQGLKLGMRCYYWKSTYKKKKRFNMKLKKLFKSMKKSSRGTKRVMKSGFRMLEKFRKKKKKKLPGSLQRSLNKP